MRVLLVLLTLVPLAGCLGTNDGIGDDTSIDEPFSASLDGAPATASIPGHRAAEWRFAVSPVDSDHVVLTYIDNDHETGGTATCALTESKNAGVSWTALPAPMPSARLQGDPWITFTNEGILDATCLEFLVDAEELVVDATMQTTPLLVREIHARSVDGGQTWTEPHWVVPATDRANVDKNSHAPMHDGSLVSCVAEVALSIAISNDGGESWVASLNEDAVFCADLLQTDDGTIVMATISGSCDATTSQDAITWTEPVFVQSRPNQADWNHPASTSTTLSSWGNNVYLACPLDDNGELTFGIHGSYDSGATWTELEVPRGESEACRGCLETFPIVATNSEGIVGVQWQLMNEAEDYRELWFAASADHGASWTRPLQVSAYDFQLDQIGQFVPRDDANIEGGVQYLSSHPTDAASAAIGAGWVQREDHLRWGGDYWHMAGIDGGFIVAWQQQNDDLTPEILTQRVLVAG